MLMEQTLHTLKALRLPGMATAFEEQQANAAVASLSFDERFSLLVDREQNWRENRRLTRLLREAKLKSSQACVEDIRYGGGRKLDKSLMAHLSSCQWIRHHQNLVLTGATGCGKTWLACAFGNAACRQGLSVMYVRTPRLFEELRIAHGDGSFGKRLALLAKTPWASVYNTHMNSKDLINQLEAAGWLLRGVKGSHHIFTHPARGGHITVPYPKRDLGVGLAQKLLKQAGLK